jgi:hypothetical protein
MVEAQGADLDRLEHVRMSTLGARRVLTLDHRPPPEGRHPPAAPWGLPCTLVHERHERKGDPRSARPRPPSPGARCGSTPSG